MLIKKLLIYILLFLAVTTINAQDFQFKLPEKLYEVKPYISIPIAVAGLGLNAWGLQILANKEEIPSNIYLGLDLNDVNKFDRSALKQNPGKREQAKKVSDIALYSSLLLPAILLFDKEIRKDWWSVYQVYFEAQGIGSVLYSWGPPRFTNRYRPVTYYAEIDPEERRQGRNRNSFFSGHVSTAATGSFFIAKVYSDYHPELGKKKWLIYGAALVPPTVVGVYRYKALKHFPTDVLTGMVIGAAVGVLVPHLHKNKPMLLGVSVIYDDQTKGLAMSWKF